MLDELKRICKEALDIGFIMGKIINFIYYKQDP